MVHRNLSLLVLIPLMAFPAGCTEVGRGNPRTLAPILGGGGPAGAEVRPPSEPVEDHVADLEALRAAWPEVENQLPRLIKALIARGSWTDVHHAAIARGGALRVRHRPAVVAEVRKLVGELQRSLLRPVSMHVAFVEARASHVEKLFPIRGDEGWRRFDDTAFRAAARRGKARHLARAMLTSFNGRWVKSERLSNQTRLSGVEVNAGAVVPRSIALATGASVQAAAWRWGEDRAVVALTGLYTGTPPAGGPVVTQKVHRELPRAKTTEMSWQGHEIRLELPSRELVELQGKLTVKRGVWTVAGLAPRGAGKVCAVVVKADWRPRRAAAVRISPLDAEGAFALEIVPIALPTESRPPGAKSLDVEDLKNRAELKTQDATRVAARVRNKQAAQASATYNLQSYSGELAFASAEVARPERVEAKTYYRRTESWVSKSSAQQSRQQATPAGGVFGALPPRLERLKAEVMREKWPDGTAVEFVANHVFVVHRSAVARKIAQLLRGTHGWRNQKVVVGVDFPVLGPGSSDALRDGAIDAGRARALRRGEQAAPAAYLLTRGGSRASIFVGEMAAALSAAWPPNRSSPPAQVFWRGRRLSVLPRLQPDPELDRCLDLQLTTNRLSRLAPATVGAAVVQHPVDSTWVHDRQLCLARGAHALSGASGTGGASGASKTSAGKTTSTGGTEALLVSTRVLP